MQIFKNRSLVILVLVLIVLALPIVLRPSQELPAVLFVIALLITVRAANSAARNQEDTALWIDAQWQSQTDKNDGHT